MLQNRQNPYFLGPQYHLHRAGFFSLILGTYFEAFEFFLAVTFFYLYNVGLIVLFLEITLRVLSCPCPGAVRSEKSGTIESEIGAKSQEKSDEADINRE
jgi:hypothetical protein